MDMGVDLSNLDDEQAFDDRQHNSDRPGWIGLDQVGPDLTGLD